MPMVSHPRWSADFATARMTALSPGQSPPPVTTPIFLLMNARGAGLCLPPRLHLDAVSQPLGFLRVVVAAHLPFKIVAPMGIGDVGANHGAAHEAIAQGYLRCEGQFAEVI